MNYFLIQVWNGGQKIDTLLVEADNYSQAVEILVTKRNYPPRLGFHFVNKTIQNDEE